MPFVVQSGSKQYIVSQGDTLVVDRINQEIGTEVSLDVLYAFGADAAENSSINATIKTHQRGEKIRVVKYKPKSNYHRQYGYRHEETVLVVGNTTTQTTKTTTQSAVKSKTSSNQTPKEENKKPRKSAKTEKSEA